jgi:hypothetical protein
MSMRIADVGRQREGVVNIAIQELRQNTPLDVSGGTYLGRQSGVRSPLQDLQRFSHGRAYEIYANGHPHTPLGHPEEVAALLVLLGSDAAAFGTGTAFYIDVSPVREIQRLARALKGVAVRPFPRLGPSLAGGWPRHRRSGRALHRCPTWCARR